MQEQISESICTAESAEAAVVPSISVDTGAKTGGYPSALEWPANGVLFHMRDALLKALDRPEYEQYEFSWSMNGKLAVKAVIPGTVEALKLEFEERSSGLSAVHMHTKSEGGVAFMDGTQYPENYDRMRIAYDAVRFIRERAERVFSGKMQ